MAMAYTAAASTGGTVMVHGDLAPPVRIARAAEHAGAVEVHGDVARTVEGDHPAFAATVAQFHLDHLVHCLRQPHVPVAHQRAHVVGDHLADVVLALAGARYRAAVVAGIRTGADERRVADPAAVLVGEATGGGGRGKIAIAIERHRADGPPAVFPAQRARVRG